MRAAVPLVHNITNFVAMNIAANVLLAAGASPAMVHAVEEAGEFAGFAGALTINIGTLSAFVLVSVGIVVLRRTRPDLKRSFRVPLSPWLPIASALICSYLMINLSVETWLRFLVWLAIGFVIYFVYSRSRSRLATGVGIRQDMLKAMDEGHTPQEPGDLR